MDQEDLCEAISIHKEFSFEEGKEKASLLSFLNDAEKLLAVETFLELG